MGRPRNFLFMYLITDRQFITFLKQIFPSQYNFYSAICCSWRMYLFAYNSTQINVYDEQCDQNGRFIGLWASF